MILLGNLTIEEMENRAGVAFPKELKEYMAPRRQQNAGSVKAGEWHCFDVPFTLVCGDMETATEIHRHLKPVSGKFKELMHISLSNGSDHRHQPMASVETKSNL
jgi:hypothetical protein